MKKIKYLLLLLLCLKISYGAEADIHSKNNGFNLTSVDKQIHYSNPGYELIETHHNGTLYTQPKILNAGVNVEPGQPSLPTVSTYYAVEPGKKFSVEVNIEHTQTYENVDILPFDTWDNESSGLVQEGIAYQQDQMFPQNIASISDPIVFRDITMVQVSITPFQYNPVQKTL